LRARLRTDHGVLVHGRLLRYVSSARCALLVNNRYHTKLMLQIMQDRHETKHKDNELLDMNLQHSCDTIARHKQTQLNHSHAD
jgi:hypothetical protein